MRAGEVLGKGQRLSNRDPFLVDRLNFGRAPSEAQRLLHGLSQPLTNA